MTDSLRQAASAAFFGLLLASLPTVTHAKKSEFASPEELKEAVGSDTEVLTRGPLHEAFATASTREPVEYPVINKEPPKPLDELPPEHRPKGDNVQWIPGYWSFEQERNDFIWISGLWRDVPPGREWVPGYWRDVSDGYRWNPGMWAAANSKVTYLPRPPKSQERGASSRRPSQNHFYVPGCWVYRDNDYRWRPGYWAPHQRGWTWVPARYLRAGNNRYVYVDGYWDYSLQRRGQLFAPVYFRNRASVRNYRPQAVLSTDTELLVHLFVRPQLGQFAFGDYYGQQFSQAGYRPWFRYYQNQNGFDPLLSYYSWRNNGNFIPQMQRWYQYFENNPRYRPQPTLAQQLTFAANNRSFEALGRTVLGNTLGRAIRSGGNSSRQFVRVDDNVGRQVRQMTRQLRNLTQQRQQVESAARGATRALQLPEIPGFTSRQRRGVPDNPRNLRRSVNNPTERVRKEVKKRVPVRTPKPRVPNVPNIPNLPKLPLP